MELVSGHGDHPPSSRDHGARGSQDPPWPMRRNGLSETWTTIAFLSKEALGLRLVTGAQFRFAECSFPIHGLCYVCIGPQLGPSRGGERRVAGACANQAFSCHISLLSKGEHVWSWFQAAETTQQAAGPRQPEARQTICGPMGSRGRGENYPNLAFPSKDALGLRLGPRAQLRFAECCLLKNGLCRV